MLVPNEPRKSRMPRRLLATLIVAATLANQPVHAQSELSVGLSMLPIASVAVAASAVGATLLLPAAVLSVGSVLTVKTIESTARGTVVVFERASDGARVSVTLGSELAKGSAVALGSVAVTTAIATGLILSVAGEVIAFIPNELGKSLLHNQRLTK